MSVIVRSQNGQQHLTDCLRPSELSQNDDDIGLTNLAMNDNPSSVYPDELGGLPGCTCSHDCWTRNHDPENCSTDKDEGDHDSLDDFLHSDGWRLTPWNALLSRFECLHHKWSKTNQQSLLDLPESLSRSGGSSYNSLTERCGSMSASGSTRTDFLQNPLDWSEGINHDIVGIYIHTILWLLPYQGLPVITPAGIRYEIGLDSASGVSASPSSIEPQAHVNAARDASVHLSVVQHPLQLAPELRIPYIPALVTPFVEKPRDQDQPTRPPYGNASFLLFDSVDDDGLTSGWDGDDNCNPANRNGSNHGQRDTYDLCPGYRYNSNDDSNGDVNSFASSIVEPGSGENSPFSSKVGSYASLMSEFPEISDHLHGHASDPIHIHTALPPLPVDKATHTVPGYQKAASGTVRQCSSKGAGNDEASGIIRWGTSSSRLSGANAMGNGRNDSSVDGGEDLSSSDFDSNEEDPPSRNKMVRCFVLIDAVQCGGNNRFLSGAMKAAKKHCDFNLCKRCCCSFNAAEWAIHRNQNCERHCISSHLEGPDHSHISIATRRHRRADTCPSYRSALVEDKWRWCFWLCNGREPTGYEVYEYSDQAAHVNSQLRGPRSRARSLSKKAMTPPLLKGRQGRFRGARRVIQTEKRRNSELEINKANLESEKADLETDNANLVQTCQAKDLEIADLRRRNRQLENRLHLVLSALPKDQPLPPYLREIIEEVASDLLPPNLSDYRSSHTATSSSDAFADTPSGSTSLIAGIASISAELGNNKRGPSNRLSLFPEGEIFDELSLTDVLCATKESAVSWQPSRDVVPAMTETRNNPDGDIVTIGASTLPDVSEVPTSGSTSSPPDADSTFVDFANFVGSDLFFGTHLASMDTDVDGKLDLEAELMQHS